MKHMIEEAIRRSLPNAVVHVDSPDDSHFAAVVISVDFEDLSLVRQHQLVMNALKGEFDSERVHALQLRTYTPDKWEQAQSKGPLSVV